MRRDLRRCGGCRNVFDWRHDRAECTTLAELEERFGVDFVETLDAALNSLSLPTVGADFCATCWRRVIARMEEIVTTVARFDRATRELDR